MTKKLNTTVHLTDPETGENRILGPKSKLSSSDMKTLREGWGKRADDFFTDDGEDDGGPDPDAEPREGANPPRADQVPADPASKAVKGAAEINEKARTDAAVKAAEAAGRDPKELGKK